MRHYYHCPHVNTPEACDIDGPREHLCETCLTTLVREERPPGWSPRVPKPDPKREGEKSLLFSERYGNPRRNVFDTMYGAPKVTREPALRLGPSARTVHRPWEFLQLPAKTVEEALLAAIGKDWWEAVEAWHRSELDRRWDRLCDRWATKHTRALTAYPDWRDCCMCCGAFPGTPCDDICIAIRASK